MISYGNAVHVEGYDGLHTIGSHNEKEVQVRNPITKREFWAPLAAIRAYQPSAHPQDLSIESAGPPLSETAQTTIHLGKNRTIHHSKYGNGEILKINGNTVCCKFPDGGRVNLSIETIPEFGKNAKPKKEQPARKAKKRQHGRPTTGTETALLRHRVHAEG
jgi:hypothetical protein